MRKIICLLLVLSLAAMLPLGVAAEEEDGTVYIQRAIQYYHHHQENAQREIADCLAQLQAVDPGKAVLWGNIMRDWSWCNTEMPIYGDVLPDGLPMDDSLCIVILGYSLKDDGSLADELLARLQVGLTSAQKYPNAYVAVTGGGTADDPKITEAGQMAAWLQENGVDPGRIIVEDQSLSTNENAVNTYRILRDSYPSVTSVAVVSSDYHLGWGCAMFQTMCHYVSFHGGRAIEVVGNAANTTDKTMNTMFSQAWGVSVITHTPMDLEAAAPALYYVEETQAVQLAPSEASQPNEATDDEPQQTDLTPQMWLRGPFVLIGAAVILGIGMLIFGIKEKRNRKRRRRENPVWKARELEKQKEE